MERHADARADLQHPVPVHAYGLAYGGHQPLADALDPAAGKAFGKEHELVATHPPEYVGWPQQAPDALGESPYHLVADVVAPGVIDRLEPVDIEIDHREALGCAGQRPL